MVDLSFSILGQVALVTGATGGIGADLAAAFGRAGARVGVAGRRAGTAEAVAEAIRAAGGEATAIELDLTDRASIDAAVGRVVATFGRLDILVNNAGLGTNHDAIDASEAEWDELFAVNVRGLFFACQSAARQMLAQGSGRIINMASQAGLVGIPRHAAYSARRGVTVNAVAPRPRPRVVAARPGSTRPARPSDWTIRPSSRRSWSGSRRAGSPRPRMSRLPSSIWRRRRRAWSRELS